MNREDLLRRLAALRKMTEENGCTEAEAASAAEKAGRLIHEYNISLAEQDWGRSAGPDIVSVTLPCDPPELFNTLWALGKFTDTKAYRHGESIVLVGTQADTDLAAWLLTTIAAAMTQGGIGLGLDILLTGTKADRKLPISAHSAGFRIGLANRMSERLKDLWLARTPVHTSSGRDLVVVKSDAVKDYLDSHGIRLSTGRALSTQSQTGYNAGRAAGDRISTSRPAPRAPGSHMIGRR